MWNTNHPAGTLMNVDLSTVHLLFIGGVQLHKLILIPIFG